jgi:GNAT superfamily N-acetyltransferase
MTVAALRKYVLLRGKIVKLEEYALENKWILTQTMAENADLPENCVSIYYYVDSETRTITDRLTMAAWLPKYKKHFKEVGVAWLKEFFSVEENDLIQLDTPEENIIDPGGEIFTLFNKEGVAVGVAAMIHHGVAAELGKMGVKKEFNGKGYSHPLMYESIEWAKNNKRNYERIDLYTAQKLLPAVSLYKKYGFEVVPIGGYTKFSRVDLAMSLKL